MALRRSCFLSGKLLKQNCFATIYKSKFQPLLLYSTDIKKLAVKVGEEKQIYYGKLTRKIKAVQVFAISCSVFAILGQPAVDTVGVVSSDDIPMVIVLYSFIVFFTVGTPFLIHHFTKKYVTQLLYNQTTGSYKAKTINFFGLTRKVTEFKPEEVRVPKIPRPFTTFLAKKKALYIDPKLFEDPEHYARIMGKPIDLKLLEPPAENKSSKNV